MLNKPKITFLGTPGIAAQILEHLICSGFNVSAVITRTDKPKGRGQETGKSPVKMLAEEKGIPVYQPKNKAELLEMAKKIEPELMIVAAFGMIIPEEVLNIPKFKTLNFHPSLLPLYRGPSPITAPILNGDKKTGVSIIEVTAKMDAGPILEQKEIKMKGDETTPELAQKLAEIGAEMLIDLIPKWIKGKVKPAPQDAKKVTFVKMVQKEEGRIDWANETAEEIERKSRAFLPWPGVYSFWNNKKVDFYEIKVNLEELEPGKVMVRDGNIIIGTQKGSILPQFLKIEGKNKTSAENFLRGYPNFINSKLC